MYNIPQFLIDLDDFQRISDKTPLLGKFIDYVQLYIYIYIYSKTLKKSILNTILMLYCINYVFTLF